MATIEKRTSATGKINYRALVRRKGFASESATFACLTDAKDWAGRTEAAMKERRHFKTNEAKKHSVADMIDRYLQKVEKDNPKRIKDVKPMLEWWKDELGYCLLSDLTKAAITEKIEKLAKRKRKFSDGAERPLSPARVNRHIAALSHACTIATNEWEWLEHHPLAKIKKMREPRGRVRFLDDDERKRLLDACRESRCSILYVVVVLALSTGARFSEIMTLEWKDVDFARKAITLQETKNGERRVLPLAGHALELMVAHGKIRRLDSPLVFPARNDPKTPYKIQTAWDNAIEKAQIEDFHFHDLRHSAASYLAMNGASLAEIAEVLGHKTLQMVRRYAHLSEAHTAGVVSSMNERIFGNG